MKTLRDDWLPIPDAPNYEINSQLICRNKKSGYVLKTQVNYNGAVQYDLYVSKGKNVMRSPRTLRAQAVSATVKQSYMPIPSTSGKYEINNKGTVRNSKTKIIIRPIGNSISFCFGNRKVRRTVADLLWEVHGIIKKKSRSSNPIPVAAENQHGKYFFRSLKRCSQFLESKVHYSRYTIIYHLSHREENIYGWKITYLDGDINHNDFALADAKTPTEVYK